MDLSEAWLNTSKSAKSAARTTTETLNRASEATTNALNALSPTFAPLAARWDAEADRRRQLRTETHLKALMNASAAHNSARVTAAKARTQLNTAQKTSKFLSSARRSARASDRGARQQRKEARAQLKAARQNYPDTLTRVAVKAHAIHAVPSSLMAAVAQSPWPASASAALILGNAGWLWLGRRTVVATATADGGLSAEEKRLMERLDPSWWGQHAEERGLDGTLTAHPEITPAGIVCGVRLDGKGWSAKKLAAETDAVRALLGMKTETRIQISRGSHGDRAQIVIRTRSASDGVSMIWTPDHTGIGVDEVTGELVDLPLKPGTHVLLAGRTGMGKSVSWRPLVMRAVMADDWTAVVIDPKRQEAIGWGHCLRCVGQETDREERMGRIYAVGQELTREMHRRQGIATGATWAPDGKPENRNLLVVIDEGAAIVRMSKQKQYKDVLDLFEELWSEARSVGFQFVWATQFPTKAVGVPAAVKENMSAFLSLTVNPGEAERAIFGETAQQEGWLPSRLDGIPGRAMLQHGKRKSDPLRLWHVTDGMVAALPAAEPWHSPTGGVPAPDPERSPLTLVKTPVEAPVTNRDRVLQAVREGVRTARDITDRTGMNSGTVSREIKALIAAGLLVKGSDGSLTAAAEATA